MSYCKRLEERIELQGKKIQAIKARNLKNQEKIKDIRKRLMALINDK
nr:MAG TPA: GENERAL CONTROL PROTEIN GCN4 ZIPPER, INTER-HELICAL ION PAIRING [Caudoviricetes sp.]